MRNWRGLFVFFVLAVVLTAVFGSAFASEETGGMSYTVDFFYGDDGAYHLPGGESMLLSQLFTEPGVPLWTAESTEAEFSDETLLPWTHEGTDSSYLSLDILISDHDNMDLQRHTQCAVFLCRLRDNKKADHGVLLIRNNPEKSLHLYKSTGQISAAACTAEDCRFSPVCNVGYTVKAER